MKILIFSDLDGTFLNHNDYSYSDLKKFISKIKKKSEIIFSSSKTFQKLEKFVKKLILISHLLWKTEHAFTFPKIILILNKYIKKLY